MFSAVVFLLGTVFGTVPVINVACGLCANGFVMLVFSTEECKAGVRNNNAMHSFQSPVLSFPG